MIITFSSKKLQKQLNQEKAMTQKHGLRRTKLLKRIMTELFAAPNLGIFAPPYSAPNRCHELKGNRKGQLSIDLDHPHRLIFMPANDPAPESEDGGLDWHEVTAIKIKGVEDTHG